MLDALQTLIDNDCIPADSLLPIVKAIRDSDVDDTDRKRAALMAYLLESGDKVSPDDITESDFRSSGEFSYGSAEYRVLRDDESDSAVSEYVDQSLWAFNASFLAGQTDLPEECFSALNEKCESGNDAIRQMVDKTCGFASFVDSAVSADGRGHFLASYDSEELESGDFFIYRTN